MDEKQQIIVLENILQTIQEKMVFIADNSGSQRDWYKRMNELKLYINGVLAGRGIEIKKGEYE